MKKMKLYEVRLERAYTVYEKTDITVAAQSEEELNEALVDIRSIQEHLEWREYYNEVVDDGPGHEIKETTGYQMVETIVVSDEDGDNSLHHLEPPLSSKQIRKIINAIDHDNISLLDAINLFKGQVLSDEDLEDDQEDDQEDDE
jgi:hypothetical protein